MRPRKLRRAEIRDFLAQVNLREPWHNRRYLSTFERIQDVLEQGTSVLDLGGRSPFTELLERHGQARVTCEVFDLRNTFPLPDRSFDVVFCLEVIEHVKDRETADIEELSAFTFTGITNCLRESWRILKPGGLLVLTTPNVCSYRSLLNVFEHRHPYQYPPHNREISLTDTCRLLVESGFVIETLTTSDAWSNGGRRVPLFCIAVVTWLMGFSHRNRDDDIMALARRPSEPR